jgi:hypothetical protein
MFGYDWYVQKQQSRQAAKEKLVVSNRWLSLLTAHMKETKDNHVRELSLLEAEYER